MRASRETAFPLWRKSLHQTNELHMQLKLLKIHKKTTPQELVIHTFAYSTYV